MVSERLGVGRVDALEPVLMSRMCTRDAGDDGEETWQEEDFGFGWLDDDGCGGYEVGGAMGEGCVRFGVFAEGGRSNRTPLARATSQRARLAARLGATISENQDKARG